TIGAESRITDTIGAAEMFFRHPGGVLSREQLLSHVWGFDFDPGSDVYVRYLRQKIGAGRIETVRGMGYRLRAH
ncbi:MAG: DNA-binding response regulator, partial [Streptosporangiales bacterium]|nr:DNA-binding response regulator [Streptosporangiales bacterium]